MKNPLGLLVIVLVMSCSCGKSDTSGCQPIPVANEKVQLTAYCNTNNITYKEDPSGLLYQIIDPGTGTTYPNTTSTITILYTGKLFNGSVFDSQTDSTKPAVYPLSSLIDGWKAGIPLIKKGGHIKLIVPSAMAYSCTGNGGSIPPNTPIFFDITLLDFK